MLRTQGPGLNHQTSQQLWAHHSLKHAKLVVLPSQAMHGHVPLDAREINITKKSSDRRRFSGVSRPA